LYKLQLVLKHGCMENSKSMSNKEKNEEIAKQQWESWIVDLEEQDQPETCGIDDDDCEACGS